jgi:aromatic-L-amino-acid decarboxylase
MPGLTHWQHPNFMAFFPACATYPSILGEMYSATFTAPAFNWLCSPACTELETIVLDWLARAFDLPAAFHSNSPRGGGGVIQGSASEAVVTCMVAARDRYMRRLCDAEGLADPSPERDDRIAALRGKLVALSSSQAHSSTHKGANIAGTRYSSIPTSFTNELSLQPSELSEALEELASKGLEPYYITLTLGTTSTCAVDDFARLEPVLRKHPNMWVHIDAAYAGTALICSEYSQRYSHLMSMADSFNTNMHKWLLVNFDASCLWVQNRNDLTAALSITPAYLQNKHTDSGLVTDYRDWQIPLGRRFRALKIWFVMRSYGIEGMQAHIRKTVKIGQVFSELVKARSDIFELVVTPAFGLTCFRINPDTMPECTMTNGSSRAETANRLSKLVVENINDRGELFLTASTTDGKSFIRVVCGNANAEEKYLINAFDVILQETEALLARKT